MVRTLTRWAAALAVLIPALAQAQPGPGPFGPYGTPGSRQANAQDVIKALNGAVQSVGGQSTGQTLYSPVIMGTDYTNPAMTIGNAGLPDIYLPNGVFLPNSALQIDVAHPFGTRGHAMGAAIQIGGGAVNSSVANGAPPIGPGTDTWNSNPTPISGYGSLDSVGLVVGNGDESNPQSVSGVTILPGNVTTVYAPLGNAFSALTCRYGEVVQLSTLPILWGAVTGCNAARSQLTVKGWSIPKGSLSTSSVVAPSVQSAPLQDPTVTVSTPSQQGYTQSLPLVLTTLAPTNLFGQNTLVSLSDLSPGTTTGVGHEYDISCVRVAGCSTTLNGVGVNSGGSTQVGTGFNVDGHPGAEWQNGYRAAHVVGYAFTYDGAGDLPGHTPGSVYWTACKYNAAYTVYNPLLLATNAGNVFQVGCDGTMTTQAVTAAMVTTPSLQINGLLSFRNAASPGSPPGTVQVAYIDPTGEFFTNAGMDTQEGITIHQGSITAQGAVINGQLSLRNSSGAAQVAYTDASGEFYTNAGVDTQGGITSHQGAVTAQGAVISGIVSARDTATGQVQSAYLNGNTGDIGYFGRALGGSMTLAVASAAPYGCSAPVAGAHVYIKDGRKPGEAAGAGTGVPADCTPPTSTAPAVWVSTYDHAQVLN